MPPMSCTSKCRMPSTRRPASRQTAKASTSRSSSVSPAASRLRNLTVCSRSSASVIGWYCGSRALMASTLGCEPPNVAGVGGAEQPGDPPLQAAGDRAEAVGDNLESAFQRFHTKQARGTVGSRHRGTSAFGAQTDAGRIANRPRLRLVSHPAPCCGDTTARSPLGGKRPSPTVQLNPLFYARSIRIVPGNPPERGEIT